MKKTLIRILQYMVFLGLGVLIIVYMTNQLTAAQRAELVASLRGVRYWLMIPTLLAGFISHYARALRWKLLLEPLQIFPSTVNVTLSVLIGYLANLLIPRAGEVAKCTVLARYEKVPADRMVGTIVAERAFDLICLLVVTLLAFGTQAGIIGEYASDLARRVFQRGNVFAMALGAAVVFVLLLVLLYRRIRHSKAGHFLKGLGQGVHSIFLLKKRRLFLIYTGVIWLMYLAQIWLGFMAMQATEHLDLLAGLVVLVFGSVGMITTQGGIGAYTFLVAKILQFYGVSEGAGQAFGWMSWLAQTTIILALGLVAVIMLPIYNRKNGHGKRALDKA